MQKLGSGNNRTQKLQVQVLAHHLKPFDTVVTTITYNQLQKYNYLYVIMYSSGL